MQLAGFKPAIPAKERLQTNALRPCSHCNWLNTF